MWKILSNLITLLLMLCLVACINIKGYTNASNKTGQNNNLFQRIGGLPVLIKIVDEFLDKVATSPRTKRTFDGIKLKGLKESVVAQLCKLTGGACIYEGETMLNAHRDAKISEAEFDAFVDMFRDTLNQYLATREKNELLKILAPMKNDIVTP